MHRHRAAETHPARSMGHVRGALLAVASLTACVSLAEPGRFDPAPPRPDRAPVSGLVAKTTPWRLSGVDQATEIAARFDVSMNAELAGAQLFRALQDEGSDLELRGEIAWMCEPISVLDSPLRCVRHETLGYGYSAQLALFTLGVWPVISIFGVPTDAGTAEASLVLRAYDPETGVQLADWSSGEVAATAYAGLYYRGSPMAKALSSAAQALLEKVRLALPQLEARIRTSARWREQYDAESASSLAQALSDPEPTIRSHALIALAALKAEARAAGPALRKVAADPEPRVRWHAVRALEAIDELDPATLATIEVLAKDPSPEVQSEALLVKHRLSFKVNAAQLAEPELASLVAQLGSAKEQRLRALKELAGRGPSAAPALPAVLAALAWASEEREQAAAIEAILSFGRFDPSVDRALGKYSPRGDSVGRAAALALAQLKAQPGPVADAPAVNAPVVAPRAAEPSRAIVAVFPLAGGKLSGAERSELTELYSAQLTALAGFKIVPSARVAAQIREQKAESYKECYDDACQIEVGKAIAAEKILTTKIIQQKGGCVVSATLYDLRTEATESAAVVLGPCAASGLANTLRAVAEALAQQR